jgi:hypothetical protein
LGAGPFEVHSREEESTPVVIHSDSNLGAAVALVVVVGAVILVLASVVLLASGKCGRAVKALLASAALVATYTLALIAVSLRTPQRIVRVGDSYCVDLWCIGIDGVTPKSFGPETVYKVDVRIFSDANRVRTSAKGASLYLVDERGRRFPLVKDPSVIPFDVSLEPGQSVKTSLTFVAAADARQLFLTGDTQGEPPFWVRLYFGSEDSLLHKRTLLRVL